MKKNISEDVSLKDVDNLMDKIWADHRETKFKMLDSVEKRYSDLNHGELLVATGAFALIVNFLIGYHDYKFGVILLNLGVTMFAITIILKSYIHRLSANRIEKEIEISDEIYISDIEIAAVLKKKLQGCMLDEEENEKFKIHKDIHEEKQKEYKKLKDSIELGVFLNKLEFVIYISGLIFILSFFILTSSNF